MTLWAARVEGVLAPEVAEFLRAEDAELLAYDCAATLEHARRLHAAELLTDAEIREVAARLAEIRAEGPALVPFDEDIHSMLERLLGPVGRKVHAGRSRNDQVAAALRLYVADACVEAREGIAALGEAVLGVAEREADTLFPGYTHLQRAQPVTLGHHFLAWTEMLERDASRFAHAAEQAGPSPLGAGALAGSTLPLPAPPGPVARNSLDAVADRDFALDYLYACAVLLGHLSRIGEELVLWSTAEFAFVRLPEEAATGSSTMPQKLNPDVAELARGKAGTAIGRLAGLLAVVKGLPLAYNRDLQEDKPPVLGARRDVRGALGALAVLVSGLEVDRGRAAEAAGDPCLLATDVAEELVAAGEPFRDAYERVAEAVRAGALEPSHDAEESVRVRAAPGPAGVAEALAAARARFAKI